MAILIIFISKKWRERSLKSQNLGVFSIKKIQQIAKNSPKKTLFINELMGFFFSNSPSRSTGEDPQSIN